MSQHPNNYGQPHNTGSSSPQYDRNSYTQPAYAATAYQSIPLERRRPQVNFRQAFSNSRKYLWHFSGRASRSEFWWAYLAWSLLSSGLFLLLIIPPFLLGSVLWSSGANEEETIIYFYMGGVLFVLCSLVSQVFSSIFTFSLGVRRLHDAGFPGVLWGLFFIGFALVPIIICTLDSSPNGLQYDKPEDLNRP